MSESFSHLDEDNNPAMVDVGEKQPTKRLAAAQALIKLPLAVMQHLDRGEINTKKGPVFQSAIIAGIMGAKRTSELIPLCHQLNLDNCAIDIKVVDEDLVQIICTAKTSGKTGVEMEALTGASVAALTIYDMCKAFSHEIVIQEVQLLRKEGGKRDFKKGMNLAFDGIGVVVAGGASKRMGADKAMLEYHGTKWIDHAYTMLSAICPKVYVSCGKIHPQYYDQFPLIIDRYENSGPLASFEAVFNLHQNAPLFMLAVDMPLLDRHLLSAICDQRNSKKDASLPYTEIDDRWHPLCGIYETPCHSIVQDQMDQHRYALWRLLEKLNVERISVGHCTQLANVNTPEELDALGE